jgi:hypothetical protein
MGQGLGHVKNGIASWEEVNQQGLFLALEDFELMSFLLRFSQIV